MYEGHCSIVLYMDIDVLKNNKNNTIIICWLYIKKIKLIYREKERYNLF